MGAAFDRNAFALNTQMKAQEEKKNKEVSVCMCVCEVCVHVCVRCVHVCVCEVCV